MISKYKLTQLLLSRIKSNKFMSTRCLSSFLRFEEYLLSRRSQADKSMLIQINGPNSVPQLESFLTKNFGPLSAFYFYSLPIKSKYASANPKTFNSASPHWILVEFENVESHGEAVNATSHSEPSLPYKSSITWFLQNSVGSEKKREGKMSKNLLVPERFNVPPDRINYPESTNLSEQIDILKNSLMLTEVGVRVRFLVSKHIENCVKTFFPEGCILPFGSTVSGIGRIGGDLDLVLLPQKSEIFPKRETREMCLPKLYFQSRLNFNGSGNNNRFHTQKLMESIADIISNFLPGSSQVQRILQARVPILRFSNDFSDLQCDLSMTNASGVHMSELIYIMGQLEPKFVSLLFVIRSWASSRKVTNPVPGKQPTNFMLVILLIYFLQSKKLLPTFDILFNNATKEDERVTADGIHCTFLRDVTQIRTFFTPQNNGLAIADLLHGFFDYYSEFDFSSRGISLFTGTPSGKPDSGPMYLQNPLERHLNVARNVSREEVSRLKSECCAALWKLQTVSSTTGCNPTLDELLFESSKKSNSTQLKSLKMKEILLD